MTDLRFQDPWADDELWTDGWDLEPGGPPDPPASNGHGTPHPGGNGRVVHEQDGLLQLPLLGVDGLPVTGPAQVVPHPVTGLPVLPDQYWEARPHLAYIRRYAHSRGVSADAVMLATLARLSAMVPNTCRVDTRMHSPVALNTMVAMVGPTSTGKTSSYGIARLLLAGQIELDHLQLSTGEGIAEAYMVEQKLDPADPDGDWSAGGQGTAKAGRGRMLTVRRQGHWNAFFQLDEGEAMFKEFEREGAKLGPILRSAWLGQVIGNQNADRSRTRLVRDFSLGMVVGFQPKTALPLLRDSHTGTPQRFLWCTVVDPNIPDGRPAQVTGQLGWANPQLGTTVTDGLYRAAQGTWRTTMGCHPAICDSLWALQVAKNRGQIEVPELDGHRPVTLVKVAGLLAILDGRTQVELEDWALASIVWDYSAAVRDSLLALDQSERQAEARRRLDARRTEAAAEQQGRQEAIDQRDDRHLMQAVEQMAQAVCADPAGANLKAFNQRLGKRLRPYRADAADYMVAQGLAVQQGDRWFCGHQPSCYR